MKELDISSRLSLILTEKSRQNNQKLLKINPSPVKKIKESIVYKYGEIDKLYKVKARIIYLKSWLNEDSDQTAIYLELADLYEKLAILEIERVPINDEEYF
jgi:hypothetical protein